METVVAIIDLIVAQDDAVWAFLRPIVLNWGKAGALSVGDVEAQAHAHGFDLGRIAQLLALLRQLAELFAK